MKNLKLLFEVKLDQSAVKKRFGRPQEESELMKLDYSER